MTIRKPLIAGNWKMHLGPLAARDFFAEFLPLLDVERSATIALFPPDISFTTARESVRETDLLLGVQNLHWEAKGAFTGETSAEMAAEAGASLALVGHSERRHLFGETLEETGRKVGAALRAGLRPVLCVGERLEQREGGEAVAVVLGQLESGYGTLSVDHAAQVVVAYEPVWAIGTGRTAAPADAAEMHGEIRRFLATRLGENRAREVPILYGGSVKPQNSTDLLTTANVDGLLVGGASLDAPGFARICGSST